MWKEKKDNWKHTKSQKITSHKFFLWKLPEDTLQQKNNINQEIEKSRNTENRVYNKEEMRRESLVRWQRGAERQWCSLYPDQSGSGRWGGVPKIKLINYVVRSTTCKIELKGLYWTIGECEEIYSISKKTQIMKGKQWLTPGQTVLCIRRSVSMICDLTSNHIYVIITKAINVHYTQQ